MGVADDPLPVDRVQRRPLPEREETRADVVGALDLVLRIGEAGEGELARGGEGSGLCERAGRDRDDLDAAAGDLLVAPAQLREVAAAERSPESSQEDEQDRLLSPVVAQAHLAVRPR